MKCYDNKSSDVEIPYLEVGRIWNTPWKPSLLGPLLVVVDEVPYENQIEMFETFNWEEEMIYVKKIDSIILQYLKPLMCEQTKA